jgi:hypothetical protein
MAKDFGAEGLGDLTGPPTVSKTEKKKEDPFAGYSYADYPEAYAKGMNTARGAQKAFNSDVEGMRSLYEKNKGASDPDSKTMAKRLGAGDVEALRLMQRAVNRRDKAPGMKKGGMVGSASKRADGCCVKGKTRGKIV